MIFLHERSGYNCTIDIRDITMKLEVSLTRTLVLMLCSLVTSACAYNPFISNNHTTGSALGTAAGAGIGGGTVALFGGSKAMIVLGGITGGAVGYYVTSMRYDASGLIQAGGNVYVLGDYIGIYIPSDRLFEANTDELLPQGPGILDSAVAVLQRKPSNNIMISGNTSGFSNARREQTLSQKRAKAVAAYLWSSGIVQFKDSSNDTRKLNYVGYGDYFPVASDYTNNGIRANSRIQITSYPSFADLRERGHEINMNTIASMSDRMPAPAADTCGRGGSC
jgi:outer membrane protein OmpA-like peptidoglycan-associated protein